MKLNPFAWLGRNINNSYNDVIAKAEKERQSYEAQFNESKAWIWISQRIVKRSEGATGIVLTNSQLFQMLKYIDHLEDRISALEEKMAAEHQKSQAEEKAVESDEELMRRFDERVQTAKKKYSAWIVYVGSRVMELIKGCDKFKCLTLDGGMGEYKGVLVYFLDIVEHDYIS